MTSLLTVELLIVVFPSGVVVVSSTGQIQKSGKVVMGMPVVVSVIVSLLSVELSDPERVVVLIIVVNSELLLLVAFEHQ